ncbi:MAG: LysM peptidoglycan-binding domain-containing protein [Chloroflexi bacterium]|nr:LysM peptidoglycan-binding domain-containing protein [Chloroflexota bacterium]
MYRNSHSFTFALVIVVMALLTAFFGQTVLAQSDDTTANEVEIVGKVTDFDGLTITIGGITFDISQAELYGSIVVGDVVEIKVITAADGTLTVREVKPVGFDDNSNDNTDDNANDNSDDNGNDNADDNGNDNADDNGNDNLDDNSNDNVDDNSNDNLDDFDDDEFKLTGTITEVGNGFIVVSGFRIAISGAEIEGALTAGALVEVELRLVNNQYLASKIEPASADDDDALPANCVMRAPAGWTTYAIRFGDTLSGIAVGSGARLADLVTVNCIANPNSIAVGTILFVPREPAPVSSSDNSNDNTDDNGNDSDDDNGNDKVDDSNDNSDDDNGNDNGDDSNDNGDDHGGDDSNSGKGGDDSDDND